MSDSNSTDDGTHSDTETGGVERLGDSEIVPRDELEQTGETEFGPGYRCPRCGFEHVTEYCDCPVCGWAGMCQEGWS